MFLLLNFRLRLFLAICLAKLKLNYLQILGSYFTEAKTIVSIRLESKSGWSGSITGFNYYLMGPEPELMSWNMDGCCLR